jgi:hypothetical protein
MYHSPITRGCQIKRNEKVTGVKGGFFKKILLPFPHIYSKFHMKKAGNESGPLRK